MKVLLGEFNGNSIAMPYLSRHQWGRMWASYGPAFAYEGEPWGFDNGAWSAFVAGKEFPEKRFLRRLDVARQRAAWKPNVCVLPDVVGDGLATLAMAEHWIPRLGKDWPWYLAVQDGACLERVRRLLPHVAGLFLGGTNAFKRTAGMWCELAHRHSKRFHFARCNRDPWLRNAIAIGADSIDTTRPVRALTAGEKGRFLRFEQLVTGACPQMELDL